MKNNEETVSSDQFFNDIMQGFEEASAFARGRKNLRVTSVRIESAGVAETIVRIDTAEQKGATNPAPPVTPKSRCT